MSSLCILAVAFSVGICLGNAVPVPFEATVIGLVGAALLVGFVSFVSRRWVAVSLISMVFVVGWVRPDGNRLKEMEGGLGRPCARVAEGVVTTPPVKLEDMSRLTLELEAWSECLVGAEIGELVPTRGRLYVTVMSIGNLPVHAGDRVRLRAPIKQMVPARNFGVPIRDASQPVFMAIVKSPDGIAKVENGSGAIQKYFDSQRNDIAVFWRDNLSPNSAALARALTLGESSVLRREQKDRFRRTGTAHLLSVSGLHLGLVVLFVFLLSKAVLVRIPSLAGRMDVGRVAAAVAVPIAIGFTLLTGFRVPVIRACVMVISALAARIMGRNTGAVEALSVAIVSLLLLNPHAIFHAGFQLSFAAVLSFMVIFRHRETKTLKDAFEPLIPTTRKEKIARWITSAFGKILRSSLAAYAVTTPIVLYHFNYVSIVGVVVNILAVPLIGFLVLPALLLVATVFKISPSLGEILCIPLEPILALFDGFLNQISLLPCSLENPEPMLAISIVCFCVSGVFFLIKRKRIGTIILAIAVTMTALSLIISPPSFPKNKLVIDFLDVGQGDATLIAFPNGERWLVDAGGSWSKRSNAGTSVVVPTLRANGVTKIDTLVLTHPDLDHVGGMGAVVESVKVGRIFENGQGETKQADESYSNLLNAARDRNVPILRPPLICKTHRVSSVDVTVLSPCPTDGSYFVDRSSNENSIVLSLTHGNIKIILTGDIGKETETILAQSGLLENTHILKLPHHGSKTSSSATLLDATDPHIAIASLGLWNKHHFPHIDVVKRLKRRNIQLFRTDLSGAVRVISDGRKVWVETVVSKR